MFRLIENFKEQNDNRQSHAFIIEKSSDLAHMHAHMGDDGYYLDGPGNKYILRTPKIHDFTLSLSVRYTMLTNKDTNVRIHYGYDRRTRKGYALEVEWKLDGTAILHLQEIDSINVKDIKVLNAGKTELCENEWYNIKVAVSGCSIHGNVGGISFAMDIPEFERGFAALQRGVFIGEWILREMIFETDEEFTEEVVLPEQTAEIPMLFGGNNPYEMKYSVTRIDGQNYLNISIDGGTYRQTSDFPGQYSVEQNRFTGAYIRAGKNKWNICGKMLTVLNQQIVWECLKTFFNATDLPIKRSWQMDDDFTDIAFGFERAELRGFLIQAGGPWEFAYDKAGKLIYSGAPAGVDWYELKSQEDKTAVKMIPKETVEYEKVVRHFIDNHYFAPDEEMKLHFIIHTDKKYITVKAEFCDVYGNKIADTALDNDYSCTIEPQKIGLYKIVYHIYNGEKLLASPEYVLEVFDPTGKKCAPLESGLPFLFSTPNEQKMLDRDSFDPWNPMPSCNAEHFIACVCFTPVYARARRTWEITKLFGREWYVWLSYRVVPGDCRKRADLPRQPMWQDWRDIVENCDYMFYACPYDLYPLRNDYWNPDAYKTGLVKEVENFMKSNPDVKLSWNPGEPFEKKHVDELMSNYSGRFVPFANERIRQLTIAQQDELRAVNPNWKSAAYGPYNIYVSALTTYYIGNFYGRFMDDTLSEYMYSGFAQFEDYPMSCQYGTYRCALSSATIMLHCKGLKLYPEQYRTGNGGCIDGAVKYAHPPLGKYDMPRYFTVTQSWENAVKTVYRKPDGYKWWDTYGFMKRDNTPDELEYFAHEWGKIITNLPEKPISRTVFITDFCSSDDRYDTDYVDHYGLSNIHNISEEGTAYIYEQCRLRGLPLGYVMKWETLKYVDAAETDFIVVPSLQNAPEWAESKLRELSKDGVGLIALSDVGGLCDLFGIKPDKHIKRVCQAEYNGRTEYITPFDAEFHAVPDGGEVVMTADGEPVIIRKGRNIYINAPVSEIGRESFVERIQFSEYTISELLKEAVGDVICELSEPAATAENAGITLYEGSDGIKRVLLVSYALESKNVTVTFHDEVMNCEIIASCEDMEINRFREGDRIAAAELTIPTKGWALLKIE